MLSAKAVEGHRTRTMFTGIFHHSCSNIDRCSNHNYNCCCLQNSMNHDFILDGEDSILSGGSSILIDGGLPAERFTNSTASFDRREERTRQHRHKKIVPGQHIYQRGQTRASTAPEYHNPEDVPAYSVFLPTIGVEVTASGGRFSVTQRRSPDRRVWRERKSTRPRTTIGPMLSEPSVEDMDGFDKDYGDRPTPIIAASPQQIIRIRPIHNGGHSIISVSIIVN